MSFDTWYREIPIVTRCDLTVSVLTTVACFFDLLSPFSLYLNYRLIYEKYEVPGCRDSGLRVVGLPPTPSSSTQTRITPCRCTRNERSRDTASPTHHRSSFPNARSPLAAKAPKPQTHDPAGLAPLHKLLLLRDAVARLCLSHVRKPNSEPPTPKL